MTIFTIGHSTRTVDELLRLLRPAAVDCVVDVRSFPRSRRNPQFNDDVLPGALAEAGVGYLHMKGLGGRRSGHELDQTSPNGFWESPGFRHYADYALTPGFREALNALMDMATRRTIAVMCAEAVWWRCHRRIITDYLLAGGVEVRHILGSRQIEPARMTPEAEPQPDGGIHYPARQPSLF